MAAAAELARMVNEVQFKGNMTSECAQTRSLVADLLESIYDAERFRGFCDALINQAGDVRSKLTRTPTQRQRLRCLQK